MGKSGGEFLPCILSEPHTYKPYKGGLRCKFLQVSESHVSKATALDVPKPVRILPIYNTGVYTGLGVRARVSHPSAKGTLRASRAVRRPNRSRSGPHSKHPSGVAMDATLAETGNNTNERMSGDHRALYSQVERDGVPNQEAWSMSRLSGLSLDSISGRAMAEKPRLIPEAMVLNDANKLIAT